LAKCYVRNGVWGWPVERQIAALGDLWDASAGYRDTLPAERAKAPGRVRPEWLTERAAMLRPSARKHDEIHVATLLALAVGEADLVSVLAAAAKRRAAIVVRGGGTYMPDLGAADISEAVQDWLKAKATARTEPGRLEGMRVAADRKRAETLRKLRVARPL